jgi:hypothetical protein
MLDPAPTEAVFMKHCRSEASSGAQQHRGRGFYLLVWTSFTAEA